MCCAMPEARTENRMLGGMAGRYATALFELARDAGAIDRVATELDTITALLRESPDLRRLVRSPVLGADEQLKAISAVLVPCGP